MHQGRSKAGLAKWLLLGALTIGATGSTASVGKLGAMSAHESKPQFTMPALRHTAVDATTQIKRASCERTIPPEALATPDPLLDLPGSKAKIAVSFIIGADGRVHSPIILESAGRRDEDRSVLDAVLAWRYRPAMCNAEPTETESKVEFLPR